MSHVHRVRDAGTSQARSMYVGSAIDDAGLDVYEFRVYAHLKRRAQDGVVWEKQENIASICCMSRKKVNEVLASLEARAWIAQERRTYKGQKTTNLIVLLEPPCNRELHGQVTDSYTAVSPTVTTKGTPHQGTPNQASQQAQQEEQKPPVKTDDEAVQFFDSVAGYGFVARHRNHLARWHETYSERFLKLAWSLAPSVPNCRVPANAFIWLLNREKEWPAELLKLYQQDQKTYVPESDGPRAGDTVTFQGRAVLVLDVDAEQRRVTIQTGADETEALTVPFSSVESA